MSISQESKRFHFSPLDIVFSCTICQKPLSTIYADDDWNNGLRKDGEGPDNGKITKLWLTECAHLTCGTHLPGGGAPFHSVNEVPRAPCPLCSVEKGEQSDKALFFINGTSKGQYDENIPDTYFQTPPIQLSGEDPGLEALRFQYLSLLRSGTKTHEKVIRLAKAIGRWEDKKPEIVRSLSTVAPLRDELLSAGRRLNALGEDISSIEDTLKLVGVSLAECLHPQLQLDIRSQYNKMDLKSVGEKSSPLDGGSRLAQGSAADLDCLNQGDGFFKALGISQKDSMRQDGSSSKRKRVDSRGDTEHQTGYALPGEGLERCRSRDQMPPPLIPMQQPFVYRASLPSSDLQSLNSQHSRINATHFQRPPISPHPHSSEGSLGRSMLAPGPSMELSNVSSVGARTNSGQSLVDRYRSPRANTATAGPVCARGGWQPPLHLFDTEHSGSSSSPSSLLPSTSQPPVRCSVGYHQASLMYPVEIGDRTIDPSSRSYQSVSSDGPSSYHKNQSALAMQSQLESQAHSRYHNLSPNRGGRITLPMTPSSASQHSSNRGIGLCSHVRSSSCHTNHQLANSSSHRQQLVISTPAHQRDFSTPHFSTRQPAYSSSLPSVGGAHTDIFRRNNSFDSGPNPVNGEMRPYTSTNGESMLLEQHSRTAQTRGRVSLMEAQASSPRRCAKRR